MPSILIRCTKFGKAVPTGLDTNKIDFETLAGIQFFYGLSRLRQNSSLEKIQGVGRKP